MNFDLGTSYEHFRTRLNSPLDLISKNCHRDTVYTL